MEIEPVQAVRGPRDLWELDEATAEEVLGAEQVATMPDLSRVKVDKKNAALKRLFVGAEWVSRTKFERKVRRLVAMQGALEDLPEVVPGAGEIVRLVDITISEIDRARVEGRLKDVEGAMGDGEILGD